MAKDKKNKTEISREVGLEIGSMLGKFFFQSDHLHYGYWDKNLKVEMANLRIAQEEYMKFLTSHIPAGVKSILDVGCGTGQIAKSLLDNGYRVNCVSPSPFLKKCANELLGDKSEVFECFYENLPVQGQYDLVMFSESFQYIKIEQSLAKTEKLLNNGGYLLISDFFRINLTEKPFMGGGHRMGKFEDLISKTPFKLVEKIDITNETAPNVDLLGQGLEKVGKPAWEAGERFLESRFPILLKLVKWKYKKKVDKITNKYFGGGITGENFKKDKRYLFLLYKKDAVS